ncbi:uncharacterized protein LOC131329399 [Rhododendron vialii]|uniref:uncharacterized protein LOC131329399 n=1 Tax=Rhododendron vialii TaxID=182163 RepID=UPI00265E86AA|nr:uncharacterized protein LOC131329399 [Rhododendron vialii]
MVNPFICGSGTFHHHSEEEDDDHFPCSSSSTATSAPRKSRKLWKTKDNHSKNPYAGFGRDKFSALLAELDGKRQEIYTRTGSEDISFVRFAYSNSNSCKPIVVKVRNRDKNGGEHTLEGREKNSKESTASQKEVHQPRIDSGDRKNKKKTKSEKQRPFYYLVAVVVLILLVLAVFGRSFAIIFVSVGWYLVPAIKGGKESARRRRKKREYGTGESEKKIANALSFPKSNGNVAANEISPRRKSW